MINEKCVGRTVIGLEDEPISQHPPDSEECCDNCKHLMKKYFEYPCCECSYTNKSSEKSYYEPDEDIIIYEHFCIKCIHRSVSGEDFPCNECMYQSSVAFNDSTYKNHFVLNDGNTCKGGENMIDCETCKNAVPETTYNHESTKCKRCIGGDEIGYEKRNSREYILDKAKECVCGHREEDYGVPEQNFQLIADLWNDYLGFNCDENAITCKDVAIMMALLKIARIKRGGGSGDSYVDLAGYAACAGELAARTGL